MKLFLALFLTISPLWPIGTNPLDGDPFLIVNKKTNLLAYIDDGKIQSIYEVSTGITNDLTPEGEFTIVVKAIDPYYRRKNIPGGSKDNPLGTRWMGFDAKDTDGRTYGIHGNNNPSSIGHYVTQGCVRMHNEKVEELFNKIPIGTKVKIIKSERSFEELAREAGAIK